MPTPVGVVAQLERTAAGGANDPVRVRWLLAERQGSTETTWALGEDPEHHRYDAYGGVLDDTGRVTGDRPSPTVSAGYTGHEHEDEVGLVKMGGRIYSPRRRRFLTADPIVSIPSGQGLNAYTYVLGVPVNWTDPSGWNPEPGFTLSPDVRDPRGGGTMGNCVGTETACEFEDHNVTSERAGAGAAGQTTATARDGEVPVLIDVSRVADLIGVDTPGFDEATGRITNFYEASRGADAMVMPVVAPYVARWLPLHARRARRRGCPEPDPRRGCDS